MLIPPVEQSFPSLKYIESKFVHLLCIRRRRDSLNQSGSNIFTRESSFFVLTSLLRVVPLTISKENSSAYYPRQMSIKGLKGWDLVINGEFRAVTEL